MSDKNDEKKNVAHQIVLFQGPEMLKNFDSSNDSVLLFFYQKEKPFVVGM